MPSPDLAWLGLTVTAGYVPHVHTHTHTYVRTQLAYVYTCMQVHTHAHICIHTHTHIRTDTPIPIPIPIPIHVPAGISLKFSQMWRKMLFSKPDIAMANYVAGETTVQPSHFTWTPDLIVRLC